MAVDLGVYGRLKPLSETLYERGKDAFERDLLTRQLAVKQQAAASGGHDPAAIKIVNDLQESANRANDASLSPTERAQAAHRYNLLNQVAKTYAIDRGMNAEVPSLYGDAAAAPAGGNWKEALTLPAQDGINVMGGAGGLTDADIDALGQEWEQKMGGTPRNAPPALPPAAYGGGVTAVPGFSDILAERKGNERQAEKNVDLNMNPQIKRAEQDQANESDLAYKPRIEQATSRSGYTEKGYQGLPQVQRALETAELRNSQVIMPKIASIRDRATKMTTGFGGTLTAAIPGTPAFDLRRDVETLLANAGFDRLQEMRDNSPTGGALGSVTERELGLLQSAAQSLMASQSKEQFLRNLESFERIRTQSMQNLRRAYDQDYSRFGGGTDPYLPAPGQNNGSSNVINWEDLP